MKNVILTINSTALPKVALSRPPRASPSFEESSSVAKERQAARGMMAKKLRMKTTVGLQSIAPEKRPSGTNTSRTLT